MKKLVAVLLCAAFLAAVGCADQAELTSGLGTVSGPDSRTESQADSQTDSQTDSGGTAAAETDLPQTFDRLTDTGAVSLDASELLGKQWWKNRWYTGEPFVGDIRSDGGGIVTVPTVHFYEDIDGVFHVYIFRGLRTISSGLPADPVHLRDRLDFVVTDTWTERDGDRTLVRFSARYDGHTGLADPYESDFRTVDVPPWCCLVTYEPDGDNVTVASNMYWNFGTIQTINLTVICLYDEGPLFYHEDWDDETTFYALSARELEARNAETGIVDRLMSTDYYMNLGSDAYSRISVDESSPRSHLEFELRTTGSGQDASVNLYADTETEDWVLKRSREDDIPVRIRFEGENLVVSFETDDRDIRAFSGTYVPEAEYERIQETKKAVRDAEASARAEAYASAEASRIAERFRQGGVYAVAEEVASAEAAAAAEKNGEYGVIFPNSSSGLLTEADLTALVEHYEDVQQALALARNEIFARHGNQFDKEFYQTHFAQFSWYEPSHKVSESELSDTERANVQTILEWESRYDG